MELNELQREMIALLREEIKYLTYWQTALTLPTLMLAEMKERVEFIQMTLNKVNG